MGLTFKALKYSLLAISNILINSNSEYIFNRKTELIEILSENSSFENDPQMNLRYLYLLYHAIEKSQNRDIVHQQALSPIISFLLNNIHKFRNILESKDSYFFPIPKLNKTTN